MRSNKNLKLKSIVIAVQATFLLQACSFQPTYLSTAEREAVFNADRKRITSQVEPLTSELTMAEAVARGLKYNTDYRVRMMEQSVALGALDALPPVFLVLAAFLGLFFAFSFLGEAGD